MWRDGGLRGWVGRGRYGLDGLRVGWVAKKGMYPPEGVHLFIGVYEQ